MKLRLYAALAVMTSLSASAANAQIIAGKMGVTGAEMY